MPNGNDIQPAVKPIVAPMRDPLIDPAIKAGAQGAVPPAPIVRDAVPERPVMLVKEAPAPSTAPVVPPPVPIVTREMTIEERVAVLENDVEELRKLAHVLAGSVPPSLVSEHAFYEYPKAMRKWHEGKVVETQVVHSAEEEKKLGSGWGDPSDEEVKSAKAKEEKKSAVTASAKPVAP